MSDKKYPVKLFKLSKDENYKQSFVKEGKRVYYDIVVAQDESQEQKAIKEGFAPDLIKVAEGKSAPEKKAPKASKASKKEVVEEAPEEAPEE